MFKPENRWPATVAAWLAVFILPAAPVYGQAAPDKPAGQKPESPGNVQIDAAFPGGNVVVVGVEGDVVRLRTDLRDTAGWWFYWNFRVRGAAGRTLRFEFTERDPIGVRGPAVSTDAGKTWTWLGKESGDGRHFIYTFPPEAGEVRFSFAIPYLQGDWERFLRGHEGDPRLRPDVLCTSRRGRPVECLYVKPRSGKAAQKVVLTARHHACESAASFVLEGLLEAVLKADTDETRWLAENVEFLAAPFVDKDGVEDGDQGKNRKPRDHNRDYDGESVYPETAAMRRLVPEWSAGALRAGIDMHCPWIRGEHNEVIYLVGSQDPRIWAGQQRLGSILEQVRRGPLPYRAADNLPFGKGWNQAGNYRQGMSAGRWFATFPSVQLATSIEIPYANVAGAEVNAESARAFGRDLAVALGRFLRDASVGENRP